VEDDAADVLIRRKFLRDLTDWHRIWRDRYPGRRLVGTGECAYH